LTSDYYHVVVLGMELGPLAAGALLARRGYRVLVVGQGVPYDGYRCFGYEFTRRPFLLTAAESPALSRIVDELTLGQLFQRAVTAQDPCYQVVLPRARLDVFDEVGRIEAEVRREIPRAAARVRVVLTNIGRLCGEIDKLLANDLVIPPESFFERREFARAEVQNPFRVVGDREFLSQIGCGDELREFLEVPLRMEIAGAASVSPLVQCRQIGSWLFGCRRIEGGRDGLRKLLGERIVGQGGDLNARQTVTEIVIHRGRVAGVRMAGGEEITGCQAVLTDLSPRELAPLVAPTDWSKRFRALVEDAPEPVLGYSINLGLADEAVPVGMAKTVYASFGPGLGDQLLRVEQVPQDGPGKAAVNVSCVVPRDEEDAIRTGALRDAILDRMRQLVPFLDNHLRVVHSSFDGFGPLDLTGEAEGDAPPIPHPEEVPRWLHRQPPVEGALGVENLPHRTGIKGLILSGSQVVSGLGTEGELVAAWGAARVAGKVDPRRERLVRSMRSKVER
jgi:phytoene dehydrogenase-like protein